MDLSQNELSPIFTARIKECCQKHYEIFISASLTILFVAFMSIDKGNNQLLYAWGGITFLILAVRFLFIQWFAALGDEQIAKKHINMFVGIMFVGIMFVWGMAWSVGSIAFFPWLEIPAQAAWFAMFMVMVSASATSHCVYMPAFFAFSLPYFLGMLWLVADQYPSSFHINALIFTLAMVTQIGAARKGQKVILESLNLRFQNLALIDNLKKERDSAHRANNAKSKFLAAASHDLRQPLHALTLFSSALEDAVNDPVKTKKLVTQINQSVDALQGLFNALLDISRLDAGTLICEKEHFNSRTLFEKLDKEFTPFAKEKNIALVWDFTPIAIFTDPTLLELILRNIVSNALRYTDKGKVEVKLVPRQDHVVIDVIDTGIGIASKHQEHIFEEFVQLHNPERDRNKGLGLGLSIVKRVANLLGSQISLASVCGEGSHFSIDITKGNPELIVDAQKSLKQEPELAAGVILVVDDETSILAAMETLLSGWGYQVICAADIEEALTKIEACELVPDCILADYRLREHKTGLEAIRDIRKVVGISTPAAIVSGDIGKDKIQLVKEQGFEMLHKPVQPAKLRSFLRNKIRTNYS